MWGVINKWQTKHEEETSSSFLGSLSQKEKSGPL